MAVTKTYYTWPLPASSYASLEKVIAYMDNTLAPFIANMYGFVIRNDLTVTSPSYAQYSHVIFFAEDSNSYPVLCLFNSNHATYYNKNFFIGTVNYVGGVFKPIDTFTSGNQSRSIKTDSNSPYGFVFSYGSGSAKTTKFDFGDGRILFIMSCYSDGGTEYVDSGHPALYYAPTKVSGYVRNNWILFGYGIAISYLEEMEQYYTGSMKYMSRTSYKFRPSVTDREFLMKRDEFWFADAGDASILNMYLFSNSRNKKSGTGFTVGNKKYVILVDQDNNDTTCAHVIPEEV